MTLPTVEDMAAQAIDTPPAEIVGGRIFRAPISHFDTETEQVIESDQEALFVELLVVPVDIVGPDLASYRLRLVVNPEFAEQLGITETPNPDTEETNQ